MPHIRYSRSSSKHLNKKIGADHVVGTDSFMVRKKFTQQQPYCH